MIPISTICVFCEDIREEKSGQNTIIGTIPDNIIMQKTKNVSAPIPNLRTALPRLGIYLRIHLDANRPRPKDISAKIIDPAGQAVIQTTWEKNVLDNSFSDSRKNGFPLVGLIFTSVMAPFPIPEEGGKITAMVTIEGIEYVAGALNVIVSTV
jgi:hypothetical protein